VLTFPVGKESRQTCSPDEIGAHRTPGGVFPVDSQRELTVRGEFDDQYGIGTILEQPRRNDLANRDRRKSSRGKTGVRNRRPKRLVVLIPASEKSEQEIPNSYTVHLITQHIAPIFGTHCVECHRDGEIGPFRI